jgi:hypothetical protein
MPDPTVSSVGELPNQPNFLTSSWDTVTNWFSGGNANTTGMTPSLTKTAQTGQAARNVGLLTTVMGGINSAIGSFYAAKSAQYQEKSQASSLTFQSDMASLNASRAETTAQSIEEAGKSQIANYTAAAGEQKAGATASMAARGIALGVGSAADVSASQDVQKSLNMLAINSNTTRQAWAARQQGTNYSNEALMGRTGAVNATASANSINPTGAGMNSLLGSATKVAAQWDWSRWMQMRMAQGSPVPSINLGMGS